MKKSAQTIRLSRREARGNFSLSVYKDTKNKTSYQIGYWLKGHLACLAIHKPLLSLALSSGARIPNIRLKKFLIKSLTF